MQLHAIAIVLFSTCTSRLSHAQADVDEVSIDVADEGPTFECDKGVEGTPPAALLLVRGDTIGCEEGSAHAVAAVAGPLAVAAFALDTSTEDTSDERAGDWTQAMHLMDILRKNESRIHPAMSRYNLEAHGKGCGST